MTLKDMGRKKNLKLQTPKKRIKCPYCRYDFKPSEEDYEYEGSIVMYWCKECGEQFCEGLKVK